MNIFEYKTGGKSNRNIEKTIILKISDWLSTIDDKNLKEKLESSVYVTGGAITSMLLNEPVNDFDIYIDDIQTAEELVKYYIDKLIIDSAKTNAKIQTYKHDDDVSGIECLIKSSGAASEVETDSDYQYFENLPYSEIVKYLGINKKSNTGKLDNPKKYHVKYITSNSITLSDDIQIITRFVGDPEKVHVYYDFVHATNYYHVKKGLVLNQKALESTLSKQLYFKDSKYPVCSIFRLRKFIKRNWRISAGEMFKIMYSISKLDLDDIDVLRSQLLGVDSAYMLQVISLLQQSDSIDKTYLFSVIDKVFNDPLSDDSFDSE